MVTIRTKKKKEKKPSFSFEDSVKADVKLRSLEKRYTERERKKLILNNGDEAIASQLAKIDHMATQAHGEIGDRWPITPRNEKAYARAQALLLHVEQKYGKDSAAFRAVQRRVFRASVHMDNRSIKREHTNVEIVSLPPAMLRPWLYPYGRSERLSE